MAYSGRFIPGRSLVRIRPPLPNFWLLGQAVKTSPFHGGNTGSIPVGVTIWGVSSVGRASALQAGGHRFEPCTPHQEEKHLHHVSAFFFIQVAGLAYHHRTKCGVSHHASACIFLWLDDIQCFALMIYRNKLRMIYTPSA